MYIEFAQLFFIVSLILVIAGIMFFSHLEEDDHDITTTPYECGFIPLSNLFPRNSIKFYVHSILFLVFDLEILILLPIVLESVIITMGLWLIGIGLIVMITLGTYIEIKENMFSKPAQQ